MGLNRSARTMLETGEAFKNGKPGRLLDSAEARWRPDITAVYKDKATRAIKIEFFEVPSAGQTKAIMQIKLLAIWNKIPTKYQGPTPTEEANVFLLGTR